MRFKNRWRLEGTLTTVSNLHLGSGETVKRAELDVEISAVATDHRGQPYLPATALKGTMRQWLNEAKSTVPGLERRMEEVFGSATAQTEGHVGGKVFFSDAFLTSADVRGYQPPWWSEERRTGVTARVSLYRLTRTASDERLFHHEYVPPGVSFSVVLEGQDLEDEEVEILLMALEAFNLPKGRRAQIRLGAGTADGWGEMTFRLTGLHCLRASAVAAWIVRAGEASGPMWSQELPKVPEAERAALYQRVNSLLNGVDSGPSLVDVGLRLCFQGPFLVNDPSRTTTEGAPDHAPLCGSDGKVVLPASSLRGALRAQAERILGTLGGPLAACSLDRRGGRPPCPNVYETTDLGNLCPACLLFGAPGWRSPLHVSDFHPDPTRPGSDGIPLKQEFLAIDRFTGGGAAHLKFNAESRLRPCLVGHLSLDLGRLNKVAGKVGLPADTSWGWIPGLLLMTLRDLLEGDIPLGYGASKGYGIATGEVMTLSVPPDFPQTFSSLVAGAGLDELTVASLQTWSRAEKTRLTTWIDAVSSIAKRSARRPHA